MKNIIVAFFVGFLVSCGTANKAEAQSEIKVAEAFYQGWIGGVRGGGGCTAAGGARQGRSEDGAVCRIHPALDGPEPEGPEL